MPKSDDDLFTRLRSAGVRKPVAKMLSELSEDAGKKAIGAGHRAVAELRVLADEIEKRLPAAPSGVVAKDQAKSVTGARSVKATAKPKRTTGASAPRARKVTAQPSPASAKPAPRGENKAKILAALTTGPRTASEIGKETGIATATVSAALTRLSKAGDVAKAERGYGLPA